MPTRMCYCMSLWVAVQTDVASARVCYCMSLREPVLRPGVDLYLPPACFCPLEHDLREVLGAEDSDKVTESNGSFGRER
eukprot:2701652-Rhodomonas_salina.1